jgi:hypothetical protein
MQQMKALGDVMAVAGSPLSNDKLIDYIIITRLDKEYKAIITTLTLGNKLCLMINFTLTSCRSRPFRSSKIRPWICPPWQMPSRIPASTPTLASCALLIF